jgi:hypothetical protein
MTLEQRKTPQQVQGIVRMVYDLCEKHDRIPTADNFYAAIRRWLDLEQTPKVLFDIGVEVNDHCAICDTEIVGKEHTLCYNCEDL